MAVPNARAIFPFDGEFVQSKYYGDASSTMQAAFDRNGGGYSAATISVGNLASCADGARRWCSTPVVHHKGKEMSKRALFIAAYDVANPARRRQLHRVVRKYATGGQKSVFECFLTPSERQALLVRARRLIDEREDRFALLRVEERAVPLLLGRATASANPRFIYVG